MTSHYLLHWSHLDGSGCGVFPYVFNKFEKKLFIQFIQEHGDDSKKFNWKELPEDLNVTLTFKAVHSIEDMVE